MIIAFIDMDRVLDLGCIEFLFEGVDTGIDAIVKASYRAESGDAVAVTLPLPRPADIVPEDLPLVIRYEDADLAAGDRLLRLCDQAERR